MLRPVSPPAEPTTEELDLFAPDGQAEVGDSSEGDGWDEAFAAADKEEVNMSFKPDKGKKKRRIVDIMDVPPVEGAQTPKALPDVKPRTAAEVALHNLTHLPYRKWCRWCVAARRPNTPHLGLQPLSRILPLLCID